MKKGDSGFQNPFSIFCARRLALFSSALHATRHTPHASLRASSTLNPRPLPVLLTLGLIIVAFACVPRSAADAQTIYKYTDKNGAVVLTDKPPKGVSAEPVATGKPGTANPAGEKMGQAGSTPPPGSMTAEEAIKQRDRNLDEVIKTVETRERERELEKQRRLREAERLETEARQPMPSTRENRQRQYELLQEAEKLRRAE
jgi:hypothetical protein